MLCLTLKSFSVNKIKSKLSFTVLRLDENYRLGEIFLFRDILKLDIYDSNKFEQTFVQCSDFNML